MGRVKKSTRKFESKHLTRTLDDRKSKKKVKQAFILREKKKAKRSAKDDGDDDDDDEAEDDQPKAKKQKSDGPQIFEDMSVEQFFAGGFEVPEPEIMGGKGMPAEVKPAMQEDEEMEDDPGEEDELEQHKGDLSALAEKDPEFYKYLKEFDPELLDFSMAEKGDLSEIDSLSDGETAGKKGKTGRGEEDESDEVTMTDIKKWKEALVDKKSLRSLRQVVLAFRAAAHVNDSEVDNAQGGFKYTITNPDGMTSSAVIEGNAG